MFFAELGDCGFNNAQFAVASLHDGVFKPRRLGKNEQGLGRRKCKWSWQGDGSAGERCGFKKLSAICGIVHDDLLSLVWSGVAVWVRTARKSRKDAFGRPAQLAHADFGGIIGTRNPVFNIIEIPVVRGIWRCERCQQVAKLNRTERDDFSVVGAI